MDNEPGEERLVADWTLTLEDMFEVEKCRGESNRRWFAIQLCFLRNEGRFLEQFEGFPLKIINFISLQLGLVPVLLMTEPGREATTSGYRCRLQNYLGIQNLTGGMEEHLRNLLKQAAVSGKTEKEMSDAAQFYLRERKVLLPPLKFFTKLIRESLLFAQEDVFTEVACLLSEEVGTELENLLEVENKRSRLFDLKEYPPKATSRAILKYLEKCHFVDDLTKNKIDLSSINSKALTQLGRIVKTIFILKYLSDEKLRRKVQKQLNRGERRHGLAKWLFFANHGEFRTGDYEEIMNKASCLSILSNAALIWNTIEIGNLIDQLRLGGAEIHDEHIAGISPLLFRHIIPNGTYHFREDNEGDTIALNTPE